MQYILLSSNFIFVNMRIIYVRRGKWQRLPGPGAGPGGAMAPAFFLRPGPGGANAPAKLLGPSPGGAMAPA